jgi:hypothetical protein
MYGPREQPGRHREVGVNYIRLPAPDVAERRKKTRGDIQAHFVDRAGVFASAKALRAADLHATDNLARCEVRHAGGLHPHFVAARDEFFSDIFGDAPAATADRRILIAEDKDAHHCRRESIEHLTSKIEHRIGRS